MVLPVLPPEYLGTDLHSHCTTIMSTQALPILCADSCESLLTGFTALVSLALSSISFHLDTAENTLIAGRFPLTPGASLKFVTCSQILHELAHTITAPSNSTLGFSLM